MKKVLLVHNQYRQFGGEDSAVSGDEKMLLENYFVEKHIYDNKESIDFYDFINFMFLTNPKSNNSLDKKIKEFNPDIIYIHNLWFKGSLGIFRLIKKHKIPVVVKFIILDIYVAVHIFQKDIIKGIVFVLLVVCQKDFYLTNIFLNLI